MNGTLRKQITLGLLVGLAAWPILRGVWVGATGVDPAHSTGWTSYSRPWLPPQVLLWKKMAGAWRPIGGDQLTPEQRAGLVSTVWQATMKPGKGPEEAFGQLLLLQSVGASAVRLEMRERGVDAANARVTIGIDLFDYE